MGSDAQLSQLAQVGRDDWVSVSACRITSLYVQRLQFVTTWLTDTCTDRQVWFSLYDYLNQAAARWAEMCLIQLKVVVLSASDTCLCRVVYVCLWAVPVRPSGVNVDVDRSSGAVRVIWTVPVLACVHSVFSLVCLSVSVLQLVLVYMVL